jgi:hypothetical protein
MLVEGLLGQGEDLTRFGIGKYYELRGLCRSGRELDVQGWTYFGPDFGTNFSR